MATRSFANNIGSMLITIFEGGLKDNSQLELEAKIHPMSTRKDSEMSTFHRVINTLHELKITNVTSRYTNRLMQLPDKSTLRSTEAENGDITWQVKNRIITNDDFLSNYSVRVSLSSETPNVSSDDIRSFIPTAIRKIERRSFTFGTFSRLDISLVEQKVLARADSDTTSVEYELELVNFDNTTLREAIGSFSKDLQRIMEIIHDTEVLYTKQEYEKLFVGFNTELGYPPNNQMISPQALFRARDLKFHDLVDDVFLDGKMRVTFKTDGVRRAMMINTIGVWLVYGNSLNLVRRFFGDESDQRKGKTTILDGEVVPLANRKSSALPKGPEGQGTIINNKYYYVVFDALLVNSSDIRTLAHKLRMDKLSEDRFVTDKSKQGALLAIEIKDFWNIGNAKQFFSLMNELEYSRKKAINFEDDGYIFLTNKMPYNSGVDHCTPESRKLTKKPDMCKWKPQSKLTIDFVVRKIDSATPGQRSNSSALARLLSFDKEAKILTDMDKKNPHFIDLTKPNNVNLRDGGIYEFRFTNEGIFEMVRPRNDRTVPNAIKEAQSVWKNIQDPIDIKDLTGHSLRLMRKYQNRIKRELYEGAASNDKFLLDIGVGRGGTLSSWEKYSRIIGVEPNIDNLVELCKRTGMATLIVKKISDAATLFVRLNQIAPGKVEFAKGGTDLLLLRNFINIHDTKYLIIVPSLPSASTNDGIIDEVSELSTLISKKTILLVSGGEDHDFIEKIMLKYFGRLADVIASMFSLTFFWKSEEMLGRLIKTFDSCLKPGGDFIFTVMDGNSVNEIFSPKVANRLAPLGNRIESPLYTIGYTGPNKGDELSILLRETIVGTEEQAQIEYLCYPQDLINGRFAKPRIYYFDNERLMSEDEKYLSKLYLYAHCKDFKPFVEEVPTTKLKTEEEVAPRVEDWEDVELPELSETLIEESEPVKPAMEVREIPVIPREIMKKTLPVLLVKGDDAATEETDYVRISSPLKIYGGFYDALLKSFYEAYSKASKEEKIKIATSLAKKYGNPNVSEISYDLDINILLVVSATLGPIELSLVRKTRPYVIIGVASHGGVDYYETIGVIDFVKETKAARGPGKKQYQTIFSSTSDIVERILDTPYQIPTSYIFWPLAVEGGNRQKKIQPTEGTSVEAENILPEPLGLVGKEGKYLRREMMYSNFAKDSTKSGELHSVVTQFFPLMHFDVMNHLLEILNNEELEERNSAEISTKDVMPEKITKYKNISTSYSKKFKRDRDLVFALADYSKDYSLLHGELFIAFNLLQAGGSIILRLGELESDYVKSLIYFLNSLFENVKLILPQSSTYHLRDGRYLLAQGLRSLAPIDNVLEILYKTRHEYNEEMMPGSLVPFTWITKDKKFLHEVNTHISTIENIRFSALTIISRGLVDV